MGLKTEYAHETAFLGNKTKHFLHRQQQIFVKDFSVLQNAPEANVRSLCMRRVQRKDQQLKK